MSTTLAKLTAYYADLLAYQFRGLPNANRQMQLYTKQFIADYFANALTTCYDLDLAVGEQLDTLGKYAGVARNIGPVTARPYFGLWNYASTRNPALYKGTWVPATNDPALPAAAGGNNGWWYAVQVAGTSAAPIAATFKAGDVIFSNGAVWAKSSVDNANGMTDYASSLTNGQSIFYSYAYSTGQNSDLPDDQYRTVIKLKIILNMSDGTLASIVGFLHQGFPGLISVQDNEDMTLTYQVSPLVQLSKELLAIFLPHPMGVGITVQVPTTQELLLTEAGDFLTTEAGDFLVAT